MIRHDSEENLVCFLLSAFALNYKFPEYSNIHNIYYFKQSLKFDFFRKEMRMLTILKAVLDPIPAYLLRNFTFSVIFLSPIYLFFPSTESFLLGF